MANLATGTPDQVFELLNRGVLEKLINVVGNALNPSKLLLENTAKLLEHVTLAADENMLALIIACTTFSIGQMVPSLVNYPNYIWALSNATFAANDAQLDFFIGQKIQKQLTTALSNAKVREDKDFHIAVLEGLENLLRRDPTVVGAKFLREHAASSNDAEIQAVIARLTKMCKK